MLKGRCALITGSTQGLGYAMAERLAAEGCNIVINGFGEKDDTWEWDGTTWTQRATGPTALWHHAMAFDSSRSDGGGHKICSGVRHARFAAIGRLIAAIRLAHGDHPDRCRFAGAGTWES